MKIGGKDREIKYGVNAIRAFLNTTGKTPQDIINGVVGEVGNIELGVTLIWAGLLHEDKSLTIDQVGDWLDEEDGLYFKAAQEAAKFFMLAFKRVFGLKEKEKETPVKN